MPTGYTAAIGEKEITFKEFAMSCARAFGALIEMRDEPMDAKVPDTFKPSDYHLNQIKEARARLETLRTMTKDQCAKEIERTNKEQAKYHRQSITKDAATKARYEAMLAKVDAWEPPTKEHDGLKKFMREQIVESIKFDCSSDYHQREISKMETPSVDGWRCIQIAKCEKDIAYHETEHAKEVERAESRTRWVTELRKSLA